MSVELWLLGGFGLRVGDLTVGGEGWRLSKAKSLIKLLALAPGHRLHPEQAAEALWPGLDPAAARNNLYQAVYWARRRLAPHEPFGLSAAGLERLRGGGPGPPEPGPRGLPGGHRPLRGRAFTGRPLRRWPPSSGRCGWS